MDKDKIFLLCLTPKERMIWEKKAYTTEEYNELTKKKIFYNRVIEETAKTILEEIKGKLGNERSLYKNDEDITKGNLVIDLIEGGEIVCYIGLKRIVLVSLDLEEIKKHFGVK